MKNVNLIFRILNNGGSVLLVGKTDSGKTYFVENYFIPFLRNEGLSFCYFESPGKIKQKTLCDIAIVDEVETLFDKGSLEKETGSPYYSQIYLARVKRQFKKLRELQQPSVYILTRNESRHIRFLKERLKKTDWGRKVQVVVFLGKRS